MSTFSFSSLSPFSEQSRNKIGGIIFIIIVSGLLKAYLFVSFLYNLVQFDTSLIKVVLHVFVTLRLRLTVYSSSIVLQSMHLSNLLTTLFMRYSLLELELKVLNNSKI